MFHFHETFHNHLILKVKTYINMYIHSMCVGYALYLLYSSYQKIFEVAQYD